MTLAIRRDNSFIDSLSVVDRRREDASSPIHVPPQFLVLDTSLAGLNKHDLNNDLNEAIFEASTEGWDGYGASAVLPGSIYYTRQFLRLLPLTIPLPSFAVDPDGEISIEWDHGRRRIFSVSIGRDGTLNYAGLIGHRSFHGEEPLAWGIPKRILDGIKSVV